MAVGCNPHRLGALLSMAGRVPIEMGVGSHDVDFIADRVVTLPVRGYSGTLFRDTAYRWAAGCNPTIFCLADNRTGI